MPADPFAPPGAIPAGTPAGQDPTPFVGEPVVRAADLQPRQRFAGRRGQADLHQLRPPHRQPPVGAVRGSHLVGAPGAGKFHWTSDTQLRWRPINFWPANTNVFIDAAGTKSTFHTGDSLVATVDNTTHQMTVTRNGKVEKTFPVSMGKTGHDTPNGTYYVLERFASIVMDSATYGVPSTSAQGYKLTVQNAVRIDNSGNFVHSAPWSVGDQGKRNVSHGCINLAPANAQWFYDNFGSGDPVVVKNSVGSYTQPDGASDWQI